QTENFVEELHRLVGLPIGVNLEPVDQEAEMLEGRLEISKGRQANIETIQEIEKLGMDFVCFTGNPGTGVTNTAITKSVQLAKEHYSGLIIAGKMHGAGVEGPVVDDESVKSFVDAGADIILVPAVGSIPGFDSENLKAVVKTAHRHGALVLTAIGTSQEGADPDTIKEMAIKNKISGADMQHIGDAGYGGLAPVDNIYAMSKAIRGERHTISRMARSINR
ncbi:MAG: haloacid dehalogenase-like hydrolase, partial [Atopostipes suicloacalis]|nr:haloacid dehalogenase-like hydrolase [Atopostipes suicloacalis]